VRSHPEWKGKTLGEVAQEPDGPRFLEALAGDDLPAPFPLKLAAALLMAKERGWLKERKEEKKGKAKNNKPFPLGVVNEFTNPSMGLVVQGRGPWRLVKASNGEAFIKMIFRGSHPPFSSFNFNVAPLPSLVEDITEEGAWVKGQLIKYKLLPNPNVEIGLPLRATELLVAPAAMAEAMAMAAKATRKANSERLRYLYFFPSEEGVTIMGTDGYHAIQSVLPMKWPWGPLAIPATAAAAVAKVLQRLGGEVKVGLGPDHTIYFCTEGTEGPDFRAHLWVRGEERSLELYITPDIEVGTVDMAAIRNLIAAKGEYVELRAKDGALEARLLDRGYNLTRAKSAWVKVGEAIPSIYYHVVLDTSFLAYELGPQARLYVHDSLTPRSAVIFSSTSTCHRLLVMPVDITVRRWEILALSAGANTVTVALADGTTKMFKITEILGEGELDAIAEEAVKRLLHAMGQVCTVSDEFRQALLKAWRREGANAWLDDVGVQWPPNSWAYRGSYIYYQEETLKEAVEASLRRLLGPEEDE
jgi:hypothetical protein